MEVKFIEANGLRFGYLEKGTGPLVLLLHGFPDTAYTWDASLDALAAAGYHAVAPFMRGYHPTAIPASGDYTTDTLAADALALIDAFDASGGPAILVGHDWGAAAAYSAAAIAPEKIRLLVTLAIPHPRSIRPTPRLAWTMRHFVTLRRKHAARRLAANDHALVDVLVKRWSPSWEVPASETARVKAAFREPGCLDAALGYYRAIGVRLPKSQRVPVTIPTVAFAGEHDVIAPRVYEKARHLFTAAYEVLQVPGGHFMHREHPAHFTTELVGALRDHEARQR
ncbi:MAG: alpha/beta hydrolase [Deltaproteobacteria bacterium]|nr:alpha/beta hydrolase [Deltaproteobacteria bacterium]